MPYVATHRFARISASKVRPVARVVQGMDYQTAVDTLRYMPQRGARLLEKVMKSARGNAEEQGCRHPEELLVRTRVDVGPQFKRIQPRARGTAYLIIKRTSHIRVRLVEPRQAEEAEE
jgi:large subunit ribosomal protein L22